MGASYIFYNPNRRGKVTGDCVIRAIAKVMGKTWDDVYAELTVYGYDMGDLMSNNAVWMTYLMDNGFEFHDLLRRCKECYTVGQFCEEHPEGTYIVGTGEHVCAVVAGKVYDTANPLNLNPLYFFVKGGDVKDGDKQ